MGDSSPAADKLMRSQGVRALPSFHFVSAMLRHHTPKQKTDSAAFPMEPTPSPQLPWPLTERVACPRAPTPASQWKNKKQIDSISGAKTQALQDAIETNM